MVKTDYSSDDQQIIDDFIKSCHHELGIVFTTHGYIDQYPNPSILTVPKPFKANPKLTLTKKNILVLSPGGGSGKFSVCLSRLYHDFVHEINSLYIKFETFPIFNLPSDHPLNIAFAVATADLANRVMEESTDGQTSYDKDIENFQLLSELVKLHAPSSNPMVNYKFPSHMGINRLTSGFLDEQMIKKSAIQEIKMRLDRYKLEEKNGVDSKSTYERAKLLSAPFLS